LFEILLPELCDSREELTKRCDEVWERIAQRAYERFRLTNGRNVEEWFHTERELFHVPSVEIHETDMGYKVQAEVPFAGKDMVAVNVGPNELFFATEAVPDSDAALHRREIFRHVVLPGPIDLQHVSAELGNGVLKITARKAGRQRVGAGQAA